MNDSEALSTIADLRRSVFCFHNLVACVISFCSCTHIMTLTVYPCDLNCIYSLLLASIRSPFYTASDTEGMSVSATTTTTIVRIIVLSSHSCGVTLQNLYLKLMHSSTRVWWGSELRARRRKKDARCIVGVLVEIWGRSSNSVMPGIKYGILVHGCVYKMLKIVAK